MNPSKPAITRLDQVERARLIAKSLGYHQAARYLALRHWSVEAALWILLRRSA